MSKPKIPKLPLDDDTQSKRFVETARKLEVDESGEAFERAITVIAEKQKRLQQDD